MLAKFKNRNYLGIVEKYYRFMNTPTRNAAVQMKISDTCQNIKQDKLIKNALDWKIWCSYGTDRNPLIQTLEAIETWKDKEFSSGTHVILSAKTCSNFFI